MKLAQNTQRHIDVTSQRLVHGDMMVSTMTAAPGIWDEGFTAAIGRPVMAHDSACVIESFELCKGADWLLVY
jgi:hypothetical protein